VWLIIAASSESTLWKLGRVTIFLASLPAKGHCAAEGFRRLFVSAHFIFVSSLELSCSDILVTQKEGLSFMLSEASCFHDLEIPMMLMRYVSMGLDIGRGGSL